MAEPQVHPSLPPFEFSRGSQSYSSIQDYMFGMRITVWRNFKLHLKSILTILFIFSLMNYIESVEVKTEASTLEKDWLLSMLGFLLALTIYMWLIYVGKIHFDFNLYEEYGGVCFGFCTLGNFMIAYLFQLFRGFILLNDVKSDEIDSNFLHYFRWFILVTFLIATILLCFGMYLYFMLQRIVREAQRNRF